MSKSIFSLIPSLVLILSCNYADISKIRHPPNLLEVKVNIEGSTIVPQDISIIATFSKAVDPIIAEENISLKEVNNGSPVSLDLTWLSSTNVIINHIPHNLLPSTEYVLIINSELEALDGARLEQSLVYQFNVEDKLPKPYLDYNIYGSAINNPYYLHAINIHPSMSAFLPDMLSFTWDYPTQACFEFQLSDNEKFYPQSIIINILTCDTYITYMTFNDFLNFNANLSYHSIHYLPYYWRVRAIVGNELSDWSTATFALVNIPMVYIPAGTVYIGCGIPNVCQCDSNTIPPIEAQISSFYISKYELTLTEAAIFLNAMYPHSSYVRNYAVNIINKNIIDYDYFYELYKPTNGKEMHPWNYVSWILAKQVADWLNYKGSSCWVGNYPTLKKGCHGYRLPSVAEWEYAARGSQSWQAYPWGQSPNPTSSICAKPDTLVSVTAMESSDISPFGVVDMCGNTGELTADGFPSIYNINSQMVDPIFNSLTKAIYKGSIPSSYKPICYSVPMRLYTISSASGIRIVFKP